MQFLVGPLAFDPILPLLAGCRFRSIQRDQPMQLPSLRHRHRRRRRHCHCHCHRRRVRMMICLSNENDKYMLCR